MNQEQLDRIEKPESTGSASEIGYKVEARTQYFSPSSPVELADGILTTEWRVVRFQRGFNPAGIPEEPWGQKADHDLLTFEAAHALAWTLIAQQRRHGIQCRLIQYELATTYSLVKRGPIEGTIVCDITIQPKLANQ